MQNRNRQSRQNQQSNRNGGFSQGFSEGWGNGRQQQRGQSLRSGMQDSADFGPIRGRTQNDYANDEGYRGYQDMTDSGLRNEYNYDRTDDGAYHYSQNSQNERPAYDLSGRYTQDGMSRSSYGSQSNFSADRDSEFGVEHDRSYGAGYQSRGQFAQEGPSTPSSQYNGTRHGSQYGQTANYPHAGQYAGKGPKGFRRSDERIKEEVCEALEHHPGIDASEIEVSLKEGICTLTGTISTRQMKRQAEECVEGIRGIQDVKNELRVDTGSTSQGFTSESLAADGSSRSTMNGNRTSQVNRASSSTSSNPTSTKQQ